MENMHDEAVCAIYSLQEMVNMKYKRGREQFFSSKMETLKFVSYLQKIIQKLLNIPKVYHCCI